MFFTFYSYRILYWLRISKLDPSSLAFSEAFAAAQEELNPNMKTNERKPSAWPVLVFLGFIFTAPYLIMKLLGTVTTTALEESEYFFDLCSQEVVFTTTSFQPKIHDPGSIQLKRR